MIVDNKKDWSIYADLYSKYRILGTPFLPYRDMPVILDKYSNGKNALDYGCGTGESTLFLKSLDYDVISVDINDKMLEIANKRDPNGNYIKINTGVLPFNEDTFDLVFCSFVLLEISTKEEILNIIDQINRVLKNGGIFISISATEQTYKRQWLTLNTNFTENKKIASGSKVRMHFKDINLTIYDYYWTEEDYIQIFQSAGLRIEEIYKPLGKDSDGYEWKDEKLFSPSSIFICKKIS